MPELSETAAKIKRRHLLGMIAGTLLFTACSNTENFSIHIAATGTKIEARQVVALVYAQSPDTEINQLLYSGGDLNRPTVGGDPVGDLAPCAAPAPFGRSLRRVQTLAPDPQRKPL